MSLHIDGRPHHHRNQKKYVIEVQDHQQAIKGANPLVDLEDTVRRGINDPLADPRFVMNKINDDFFGTPVTDTSLHNNELMAYQGRDRFTSSILGVNTNTPNGLTPSNPIQQHATKEEIVARHPASIPMIQDVGIPRFLKHGSYSRFPGHTRNFKVPLNALDSAAITANIAQNVAGGLSRGLPGSVAAFASRGKFEPFARGIPIGALTSQQHANARRLSRISVTHNKLPQHRMPLQRQNNLLFHSAPKKQNNLNPLTGLPEDLEDRTFGAVSSITSVADTSPSLPSSITVTTGDNSEASETQNAGQQQQQEVASEQETKENADSTTTDKSTPGIGSNFSSLKAYLEADNELRENLAKDGLETLEPSKKVDSAYKSLYNNAKRSIESSSTKQDRRSNHS